MSGHGIGPTWFGNTKFGEPLVFSPEVIHAIFANCDIAFLGDVDVGNNFSLVCEIDSGNVDSLINLLLNCETTEIGDLNPGNILSVSVIALASGP